MLSQSGPTGTTTTAGSNCPAPARVASSKFNKSRKAQPQEGFRAWRRRVLSVLPVPLWLAAQATIGSPSFSTAVGNPAFLAMARDGEQRTFSCVRCCGGLTPILQDLLGKRLIQKPPFHALFERAPQGVTLPKMEVFLLTG